MPIALRIVHQQRKPGGQYRPRYRPKPRYGDPKIASRLDLGTISRQEIIKKTDGGRTNENQAA